MLPSVLKSEYPVRPVHALNCFQHSLAMLEYNMCNNEPAGFPNFLNLL